MLDLDEIRNKPIAILGGGAVGKTCGADCALAGQNVRICDLDPFFNTTLKHVSETGITLQDKLPGTQTKYGFRRMGKAHFSLVTNSIAECVAGAKVIIIGIPSIAHEKFFKQLIPVLEDGQIIHIIPDNYGSLKLRKMMVEMNCNKKVLIGGWSSAPYGTRVNTEGGIPVPTCSLVYRAITLRGAAQPASDTKDFVESSKSLGCFDAITFGDGAVCGDTVLDIGFSNVNPVIHVPGTLLGVSTMENFDTVLEKNIHDYSIYSFSFCPSISEVQYQFYNEEVAIAKAIGVGIQPFNKDVFFQRTSVLGEEYMGEGCNVPFEQQWEVGYGTGPFNIKNRYITEDIPVGCHVYHELGKKFNVETPVIDSMIVLGSVMSKVNYFEQGLKLKDLGIDEMSKKELINYLYNGK